MKVIVNPDVTHMSFKELTVGTVFECDDYYIKAYYSAEDEYYAVNLSSGIARNFPEDMIVRICNNAEVVIIDKKEI